MSFNLYSEPEKFGLRPVGKVEWSDGCYQFDLTVVWQDSASGALYFADDSGCSCPAPFEETGRDDLTPIDRPQVFIDHIDKRIGGLYEWNAEENERAKGDAGELVQKVRQLLRGSEGQ